MRGTRLRLDWYDCKPGYGSSHQKLEETKMDSLREPVREHGPAGTLILDLLPTELEEKKFLLFQATQFVVICYSNPRKTCNQYVFSCYFKRDPCP